jgi:outer membrane lipoprotein SlyB
MNSSNTQNNPFAALKSRNTWLIGGGLTLAGLGLAAGLALHPAPPAEEGEQVALKDSLSADESLPSKATPSTSTPAPKARTARPAPAAVACADCGVVESVHAVQQKGEGTGAGAVVGGVLGGVVGNQMGGGNGKKAMTVLGAIGGGFAGNEVEKQARSTTVYDVRVRMDDGTLRSMTLAQAPAAAKGERVTLKNGQLQRLEMPRHAT